MFYYIYQGKSYGKYNEVHTSECLDEANEIHVTGFRVFHEGDSDLKALEFAKQFFQVPEATACPKCMNID